MNETWTELSSNRSLALMMFEPGNGQMVEVNGVSMAPPGWELHLSLNKYMQLGKHIKFLCPFITIFPLILLICEFSLSKFILYFGEIMPTFI